MIARENLLTLPFNLKFRIDPRYIFTCLALLIYLLMAYSNSFYGDWHFDDYFNIVTNPYIQIQDFSWDNLKKCSYGLAQERPSRPLAYLSFALNYWFDGTNVFGYHLVNFIIHYLAAVFLFLFLYNTFSLPLLERRFSATAYPVALLATFFWAANPVHVTSITYIVQRMASMAGLFYIMAMYFYLKGRTTRKSNSAVYFYIICCLCSFAAILSKENAAMLPVSIFFYDLFLIRGIDKKSIIKYLKIAALPCALILITGLIYVDFSTVFDDYKMRDFTMWQRLLTEPRVIIFYLTLLFYPVNSRLTLLYDFEISRSLLQPWSTFPAILLILILIGFSFYIAKRRPLISYCILFYFLNHLIEGSIFNLEIVYEHRNYIPAMLLFVPVTQLFISALDYFSSKKHIQWSLVAVLTFLIAASGTITYQRNAIISDDFTFWFDNTIKSPLLSRTHSNLGNAYLTRGERDKALSEYEKAIALNNFGGIYARAVQEHNLGLYKFTDGKYDEALACFEKSDRLMPFYISNIVHMAKIRFIKNELPQAYNIITSSLKRYPHNQDLNELLCLTLLRENKFPEAAVCAKSMLQHNLTNPFPLAVLAQTSRNKGNLPTAISLWRFYQQFYPHDPSANMALIELYAENHEQKMLSNEIGRLLCLKGNKSWQVYFNEYFSAKNLSPYRPDYDALKSIIYKEKIYN